MYDKAYSCMLDVIQTFPGKANSCYNTILVLWLECVLLWNDMKYQESNFTTNNHGITMEQRALRYSYIHRIAGNFRGGGGGGVLNVIFGVQFRHEN